MKVKTSTVGITASAASGGMFKNVKDIDGAAIGRSSSPGTESFISDPGHQHSKGNRIVKLLHRFKAEERLHRAEQHGEDALNRSEHDEITRPWHSQKHRHHGHHTHDSDGHYERRSFRNVKYIDEKDEAWQNKSCSGGGEILSGGVDHITDHYSDSNDPYNTMNKSMSLLDRADNHRQHHETMLEVMERLQKEEQQAKIVESVEKAIHTDHPYSDSYLRRTYSNNDKRDASVGHKAKGSTKSSMLEAMEHLMGKDSIKLGHVAERPKLLIDSRRVKSEKPLQPALRKPFAPRA